MAAVARKLRLEFPGAIYHVINRGNYRAWIFREPDSRAAFQSCLFEACERSQWLLHAFVIMGNHFHLALETPAGNLVRGMHWLQATFALRFNRYRREHGHLFQGRYKSLIVEDGLPLGQLCHYIHLNPGRANIVGVANLADYRHSSYWFLRSPASRPKFLRAESALVAAGGLTDTPAGQRSYEAYLDWQMAEGPAGKSKAYVNLSRGWALGSRDFKMALVKDYDLAADVRALELCGKLEVSEMRWSAALAQGLVALHKSNTDALADPKSSSWKLALAAWLKGRTDVSNTWLATHLHLGTPGAFAHNLTCFRRAEPLKNPWWRMLVSRP